MGVKIGGHIEKVNGKGLSYGEFAERYLAKNRPVVLTGLMDHWRACRDWVTADGHPNLLFFATHFGKSKVQVADCGTREFTDQKRVEMSVSEFIGQWLNDSSKECSNDSTQKHSRNSVLYLKDWHFVKEYPDYIAYTTPLFCLDDWLNLYLDSYKMHEDQGAEQENDEISCSDYRFVYMGAKGSWTPLHADVFRSYSWSANVCGQKQWLFLPPSQCHLVFDRNMKSCVYDIFDNVNEIKFPGFEKAIWLECTQERNEIIFVPSGWYHQVHNMEDTISINHNWFNGCNLSWVWDLLVSDYDEAKEYIEDIKDICDDFEGLCQRNLAANTGMNFRDFFIFIARFSFANLVQLCNIHDDDENHIRRSFPVAPHLVSNLISMRRIASKMKSQGLEGNQGFFLDLKELLDAPRFHKLCMDLGMTYGLIHEQHNWSCGSKNILMDKFRSSDIVKSCSSYQAFSPENLIQIVDNYIQKLNGICSEENDLSSKLDNALLVADS